MRPCRIGPDERRRILEWGYVWMVANWGVTSPVRCKVRLAVDPRITGKHIHLHFDLAAIAGLSAICAIWGGFFEFGMVGENECVELLVR